jgi:hypothetical protein
MLQSAHWCADCQVYQGADLACLQKVDVLLHAQRTQLETRIMIIIDELSWKHVL